MTRNEYTLKNPKNAIATTTYRLLRQNLHDSGSTSGLIALKYIETVKQFLKCYDRIQFQLTTVFSTETEYINASVEYLPNIVAPCTNLSVIC